MISGDNFNFHLFFRNYILCYTSLLADNNFLRNRLRDFIEILSIRLRVIIFNGSMLCEFLV